MIRVLHLVPVRLTLLAFTAFVSNPALSQNSPGTRNYPLGRLFLAPEQRLQLDQPSKLALTGSSEASSAPGNARINGVVQRSAGRTVIWVDGVPRHDWPIELIGKVAGTVDKPSAKKPATKLGSTVDSSVDPRAKLTP
jgi:hypothetical protein